jgi:hypothetical protein
MPNRGQAAHQNPGARDRRKGHKSNAELRTRVGHIASRRSSARGWSCRNTSVSSPVLFGGLVNVVVTDVIDDVTVTVQDVNVSVGAALGLAANVCGVGVNVLAQQLRNGDATCAPWQATRL